MEVDNPKFDWSKVKFVKTIRFTPAQLSKLSQTEINEHLTFRMVTEMENNKEFMESLKKVAPLGWLCGGIQIEAKSTYNFTYASLVGAAFVIRNKSMIPNPDRGYLLRENSAPPIGMMIHPQCPLDSHYPIIEERKEIEFSRSFLAEHDGWTISRIRTEAPLMDKIHHVKVDNPVFKWIERKTRDGVMESTKERNPALGGQALQKRFENNYKKYMEQNYPKTETNRVQLDEKKFDEIVVSIEEDNHTNLTVGNVLKGLTIRFLRLNPPKPMKKEKSADVDFEENFTFEAMVNRGKNVEWTRHGDSELDRTANFIDKQAERIFNSEQTIVLCISILVAVPVNFHNKPAELQNE